MNDQQAAPASQARAAPAIKKGDHVRITKGKHANRRAWVSSIKGTVATVKLNSPGRMKPTAEVPLAELERV